MAPEPEDDPRLRFDRDRWAEERDLRSRSLELERKKWVGENELRAQELRLKVQAQNTGDADLELRRVEHRRSRWANPLTVAIFSAAAVGLVNVWTTYNNSDLQRNIEVNKEDAALILETLKTAGFDKQKSSTNLQLLVEADLLANRKLATGLQTYIAKT
jgi:hypothetical protein